MNKTNANSSTLNEDTFLESNFCGMNRIFFDDKNHLELNKIPNNGDNSVLVADISLANDISKKKESPL